MQNYVYDLCKQHMHQHVLIQMTTGEQVEGVVTNVDDENVYLTAPTPADRSDEDRQYNPYGYGSGPQYPPRPRPPYGPGSPHPPRPRPPYGGGYPPQYPGHPYPPYYGPGPQPGQGSLNQLVIPLAALAAISVLPLL